MPIASGFAINDLPGYSPEYGLMLHFGTAADAPAINSIYAVPDRNQGALSDAVPLALRQFTEQEISARLIRTVTGNSSQSASEHGMGWKLDLPEPGEYLLGAPIHHHGRLLFSTRKFSDTQTPDPCQERPEGWVLEVDANTGLAPSTLVLDIDGNGEIDRSDLGSDQTVPSGSRSEGESPTMPVLRRTVNGPNSALLRIESDTSGEIQARVIPMKPHRIAWRQLDAIP